MLFRSVSQSRYRAIFPNGNSLEGYNTIQGIYVGKFPGDETLYRNSLNTILNEQKLETLEKIRDEILKQPGNTALGMTNTKDDDVNDLFESIRKAATNKLGGLVLKTYDSDVFNNWVKTDWIDGENGI